jgi:predicted nucleotidyltransferase
MENWEKAATKFLEPWKRKSYVIGAIVCGSYVTGNPSEHSDIDIFIILEKSVKWRDRGNVIVDGFLIEYFANPASRIKGYFEKDFDDRRKVAAHMFATGKVIFSKNNDLKKLIIEAKKFLRKPFRIPAKSLIEIKKYHIWDMLDNLEEIYDRGDGDFMFVYYSSLKELIDHYNCCIGYDHISSNRAFRSFADPKYRRKYCLNKHPDEVFSKLFLSAILEKSPKIAMKKYLKLSNRVTNKLGGFDIDGWNIRTPAE